MFVLSLGLSPLMKLGALVSAVQAVGPIERVHQHKDAMLGMTQPINAQSTDAQVCRQLCRQGFPQAPTCTCSTGLYCMAAVRRRHIRTLQHPQAALTRESSNTTSQTQTHKPPSAHSLLSQAMQDTLMCSVKADSRPRFPHACAEGGTQTQSPQVCSARATTGAGSWCHSSLGPCPSC